MRSRTYMIHQISTMINALLSSILADVGSNDENRKVTLEKYQRKGKFKHEKFNFFGLSKGEFYIHR